LVGDHPGTIPVEFGKIPISGSREEVVCSLPYIIQCKIVTPGHNLNNFGRGPLDDANYTKFESPGPCSFRQEDF